MLKVPANAVAYYATEIKEHWHKALESIFAVCDLLVEAKTKLDPSDWELLKDELPFSESVCKKLYCIGIDPRLRKPRVAELLPPNYTILYEVTQLEDQEFEAGVKEHQIWPRMNRASFTEWRNELRGSERNSHRSKIPFSATASIFATLTLADPMFLPPRKALKLKEELGTLTQRYAREGVRLQFGIQERIALQRARKELADKFKTRFHKVVAKLNSNISQEKLDLIESALWQHRALDTDEPLPYPSDHPNSIEHKRHPYSIQRDWTHKSMLEEMRERHLVTTWTPIKDSEDLVEARTLQLAIRYLESGRGHDKLEAIAKSRSKAAKFASNYLVQMAGL